MTEENENKNVKLITLKWQEWSKKKRKKEIFIKL